MIEEWRDIAGYEGLYQVSNLGRIKSLYDIYGRERILKKEIDGPGYCFVSLYKDKVRKHHKIHRLVAQAFLPNPNNLPQVNHKDENTKNNFVFVNEDGSVNLDKSNLEWCDAKYNSNYGTVKERRAQKHFVEVVQLDLNGKFIKKWCSIIEAARECGVYTSGIINCCKGKLQVHKGYKWMYLTDWENRYIKDGALF